MSRKVWLVKSRLAVRNGRRRSISSSSASPAIHTPGKSRRRVRFSSDSRNGPGRSVDGAGRRDHIVEDQRHILPLAGRLALDFEELRGVRDRLHHDQELGRQMQRQLRLLARRQFQRVECQLLGNPLPDRPAGPPPKPQKICRKYSKKGNSSGSWPAILRMRRVTVNVTSTISSSVGS